MKNNKKLFRKFIAECNDGGALTESVVETGPSSSTCDDSVHRCKLVVRKRHKRSIKWLQDNLSGQAAHLVTKVKDFGGILDIDYFGNPDDVAGCEIRLIANIDGAVYGRTTISNHVELEVHG